MAILLGAFLGLAASPAAAANTSVFSYIKVIAPGCITGAFTFDVVTVISEPGIYHVVTTADVGAIRYMHEDASILPEPGASIRNWGLFDSASGGPTDGVWPIPAGQPVNITSTMVNPAGERVWESRVTIASCDSTTITSRSDGPVNMLVQNGGFEKQGATVKEALKWVFVPGNDRRVCNSEATTVAHTGKCAYRFKGVGDLSQKWKNLPIAEAGDEIRLSAWVMGTDVAAGSTISATVRFVAASAQTITINVPEGSYEYQQIVSAPLNVPSEAIRVTLTIAKVGAGTLLVDDVFVGNAVNAGTPPLLPLPVVPEQPLRVPGVGGNNG